MKDYPPPKKKKKKKKKKVLDHYLHDDLGMLPLLRCFFAHLLILQYPDHHQNLISSSLYYSGAVHKISSQSVHNFLSNVVRRQTNKQTNKQTDRQTDRQTNQRYQKHNLLCQGDNNNCYVNTNGDKTELQNMNQKSIYKALVIKKLDRSAAYQKYTATYNLDEDEWKSIYLMPHTLPISNKAKEMHYKIVHGYNICSCKPPVVQNGYSE